MHSAQVTDPQAWDQALLALPNPHILQSWAWGEFKARHGWQATRLCIREGDRTLAAASVLERRLPHLPASILYVPKGPALDWTDAALAGEVLAALEGLARRRRALFVKIDPDVYTPEPAEAGGVGSCSEGLLGRPACAPQTIELLAARGWRLSDEQIQFRNTLLIDITHTEDELLGAMKQKTRYNVRLAARKGVAVRPGTPADLDIVYQLYAETARRDGFIIRPPDYYRDAWGRFIDAGLAHLLLAEVEGEAVAGLILFVFGQTAWYMYGASSDRHRERMPSYLLQWEAIRLARALGCSLYDLWGAPEHLDESDPMWGVVRFKLGLGGTPARGLGAWDFPASRPGYWLYSVVMPRYLGWLRGRHEM